MLYVIIYIYTLYTQLYTVDSSGQVLILWLQRLLLSWPPRGKGIESPNLNRSPKKRSNIYKTQHNLQLCWRVLGSGSTWISAMIVLQDHFIVSVCPSCVVPPFLRGGTCAMPCHRCQSALICDTEMLMLIGNWFIYVTKVLESFSIDGLSRSSELLGSTYHPET